MSMRFTILGCGSSGGVPRVGNIWGNCDPTNPKNRRRRCALLVERFGKRNQLTEGERGGILRHLIEGGDLTRYGLHGAVTRFSADVEDYDRATEFEKLGGAVIELPKSDWMEVLKAA